jgi:phosphoglycerol transferase MdoB-like AlkP superfamily enzyme
MKDVLINMMVTMMPLMQPLMWAAIIAAALGVLFAVVRYAFKAKTCPMVKWSSRVVFAIAIFFLASQLMGELLSMPPTFNLGDANNFEFILVSFWKVGAALLAAGLIIHYSCKLQPRKTAS